MDSELNIKKCPHCEATWVNGQHYWAGTQKPGNDIELAKLVCYNPSMQDERCINPFKGKTDGDGWAQRLKSLNALEQEFDLEWKGMEDK